MLEKELIFIIIAFAGGIFGAVFGGLNAFLLCGLSSIAGTIIFMVTGKADFNSIITWGPFLGPHVAFAGSVAAAAYAKKIGKHCDGKDILTPLFGINSPKVLLIGGVFGSLGYIINIALTYIPKINLIPATNTITLTIVIICLSARIIYGDSGLTGTARIKKNRWLIPETQGWQPWLKHPALVIIIGISVSLLAGGMVKLVPGSNGLFFGFSALTLAFFHFGARIPVILHIALCSEIIFVATDDIGWSIVFGILASFFSEIFAGLFLIHGDTYIDPPAMAIATVCTIYPLLSLTGILNLSGSITIIFAILTAVTGYFILKTIEHNDSK